MIENRELMSERSFVIAATRHPLTLSFRLSSRWDYLATCSQARIERERFEISIGSWKQQCDRFEEFSCANLSPQASRRGIDLKMLD